MYPGERHERIVELARAAGRVEVALLADELEATPEPVRRDPRALELIASGAVPVDDLITRRLPLEEVGAAIAAVVSGEAIKVVVEP